MLHSRFLSPGEDMIGFREESREEYREKIRKFTDKEIIERGRSYRELNNPPGKPNPIYTMRLEELRDEWRRRHPKQK
jgi:hypothetical protein